MSKPINKETKIEKIPSSWMPLFAELEGKYKVDFPSIDHLLKVNPSIIHRFIIHGVQDNDVPGLIGKIQQTLNDSLDNAEVRRRIQEANPKIKNLDNLTYEIFSMDYKNVYGFSDRSKRLRISMELIEK